MAAAWHHIHLMAAVVHTSLHMYVMCLSVTTLHLWVSFDLKESSNQTNINLTAEWPRLTHLICQPLLHPREMVHIHAHHLHQGFQHTLRLLASLQRAADHPSQMVAPGFPLMAPYAALPTPPAGPLCLEPWGTGAPLPLPAVRCW